DAATAKLSPTLSELATRPQLDPRQVQRVYKKLGLSSLADLQQALADGRIRAELGPRLEFHVRQGLSDTPRLLLWEAEKIAGRIEGFLRNIPGVRHAPAARMLTPEPA